MLLPNYIYEGTRAFVLCEYIYRDNRLELAGLFVINVIQSHIYCTLLYINNFILIDLISNECSNLMGLIKKNMY